MSKTTINVDAARDLELYTINTGAIYRAHTLPTIAALKRKAARGTYDPAKAVKAWEYVATAAAKLYCKEFCSSSTPYHAVFTAATRRAVAEALTEYYADHVAE